MSARHSISSSARIRQGCVAEPKSLVGGSWVQRLGGRQPCMSTPLVRFPSINAP